MAHAQHNPLAVALSFPPLHGIATPGVAVASPTTSSGPHLPLPPSPTREEQQSEYSWHHHRPAQQWHHRNHPPHAPRLQLAALTLDAIMFCKSNFQSAEIIDVAGKGILRILELSGDR
jgi:hypothetical protein